MIYHIPEILHKCNKHFLLQVICHHNKCTSKVAHWLASKALKYHHHVPERLGVFPVPWSSRWSWSLHLFLGRPMFLCPFGLYCSACFGSPFVSILCTCCSHFFWYCFIFFTVFCAPIFCQIHRFFSLSSFVIPSRYLKNFICAASKCCSSLFFSTQASLPNFNAALAVMLWILNFVCLFVHLFSKMSPYSSVYFVICLQFIF